MPALDARSSVDRSPCQRIIAGVSRQNFSGIQLSLEQAQTTGDVQLGKFAFAGLLLDILFALCFHTNLPEP